MKKLILFLAGAVLWGCTCLSQIPDQLLYVDQNCEAVLPDYTTPEFVNVADNCALDPPVQLPPPGTILDSGQPLTPVTISVTDISGNQSSVSFNVILVDTIPPTIEAGPGLMGANNFEMYGKVHMSFLKSLIWRLDSVQAADPMNYAVRDTSYRTDKFVTVAHPNSRAIGAAWVDPSYIQMAASEQYFADSLHLRFRKIQINFESDSTYYSENLKP